MSVAISNGFDGEKLKRFNTELDRIDEERLSLKGEYMQRCKTLREREDGWFEQADAVGIPRKPYKHYRKGKKLQAAEATHRAKADPEVVETADMIDFALGGDKGLAGTPFGAAAGGTGGEEEDLRGADQKNREAARQAEAKERLAGMKSDTADKAKASRKKKSAALDDLADGAIQH